MTEIEIREAMIWLEDLKQKYAVTAHWWGACECALAALREKQEREKGCDFCKKELNDYPYINACGDCDSSGMVYTPAFCPICGRPLTEK